MNMIIFLYFLMLLSIQECFGLFRFKRFQKDSKITVCGTIFNVTDVGSIFTCSLECMKNNMCAAVLFNENEPSQNRCKLISLGSAATVDMSGLSRYEHFVMRPDIDVPCNNMGVAKPEGWRSGCPKLYFPLDYDQSAGYGGSSANSDFSTAGKLGQALYIDNTAAPPYAYLNLGSGYTLPEFCFPDPGTCGDNGVSFALWMKLPSHPTTAQGYLTTAISKGPGFVLLWNSFFDGLVILVRRESDIKQDYILIAESDMDTMSGSTMPSLTG